jgi:type II secretory pathway predicted ATPase ExeA
MYREFFKFTDRPFRVAPDVDSYVAVELTEGARTSLVRAIERCEGPGLLVGPTGCGKSLVCHLLADHVRETHQLVFLESSQLCTRRALLQHILFELDQPYQESTEGALRLALRRHLQATDEFPSGVVVIVDEADRLSIPLLEELRMLTNVVIDGRSRVQLVLSGSPRLEEHFNDPRMDSFNQRLACRCYLRSLKRDEAIRYVQSQMERVGGETSELFSPEALISLYELTSGIPRLINQLCDHALLMAAEQQRRCLEADDMQIAWADLQQLPVPISAQPDSGESTQEMVEFGELDDTSFDSTPGHESTTIQFGSLDDEPELSESRIETMQPAAGPEEESSVDDSQQEPPPAAELQGTEVADEQEVAEQPVAWLPPAFADSPSVENQSASSPLPADDSDMIVVENNQHLSVHGESEELGKPHLRLYRELFDRLRQD